MTGGEVWGWWNMQSTVFLILWNINFTQSTISRHTLDARLQFCCRQLIFAEPTETTRQTSLTSRRYKLMAQDRMRKTAVTEVWECTGIRLLNGLTSSLFLSMQLGWGIVPEIAESPSASHQPAKTLGLQPHWSSYSA